MPFGIKTHEALRAQLRIHPWEEIPAEALEAFNTAIALELLAKKNKELLIKQWVERLAKRKVSLKSERRLSFGSATLHGHKHAASAAMELHDRVGREVLSTPAIEGDDGVQALLTWCTDWTILDAGLPDRVDTFLANKGLTRKQLIKDLQVMVRAFVNKVPYILGYKTSFKLKPYYEEMKLIPAKGLVPAHWELTGNMIYLLPRLRLYLIKILQDKTTSASSIQRIWRGYRVRRPPPTPSLAPAEPPIAPPEIHVPANPKQLWEFKAMTKVVSLSVACNNNKKRRTGT